MGFGILVQTSAAMNAKVLKQTKKKAANPDTRSRKSDARTMVERRTSSFT